MGVRGELKQQWKAAELGGLEKQALEHRAPNCLWVLIQVCGLSAYLWVLLTSCATSGSRELGVVQRLYGSIGPTERDELQFRRELNLSAQCCVLLDKAFPSVGSGSLLMK